MLEIIKFIVLSAGAAVCLAGGVALAGAVAYLATDYAWKKMKALHGIVKLHRIVVEHDRTVAEYIKIKNIHNNQ